MLLFHVTSITLFYWYFVARSERHQISQLWVIICLILKLQAAFSVFQRYAIERDGDGLASMFVGGFLFRFFLVRSFRLRYLLSLAVSDGVQPNDRFDVNEINRQHFNSHQRFPFRLRPVRAERARAGAHGRRKLRVSGEQGRRFERESASFCALGGADAVLRLHPPSSSAISRTWAVRGLTSARQSSRLGLTVVSRTRSAEANARRFQNWHSRTN